MNFQEYDQWRSTTDVAKYSSDLVYPTLGLNGEAGEVAEKVKKNLRDWGGVINQDVRRAILLECGDVLWYLSTIVYRLGSSLEEVATMNVEKLRGRAMRGTLEGNGDER